ncbi:MAG: YcaO-like family protein [Archangium sp.]
MSRWRSNGLGAHPTSRTAAEEHALLEVMERHLLAQTLPDDWTEDAMRSCFVHELKTTDGFAAYSFELTPVDSKLHLAGVLLFDLEEGPVPLTAGYACRRSWAEAEEGAYLEAAQSRLTEIHGAREDVLVGVRESGREALSMLQSLPVREVKRRAVRDALSKHMEASVAVVQLSASPFVVKVVAPGLAVSELL